MFRTVGAALGLLLIVLFFASIGERFARPVSAAQTSSATK
jgi:hypothetical protein